MTTTSPACSVLVRGWPCGLPADHQDSHVPGAEPLCGRQSDLWRNQYCGKNRGHGGGCAVLTDPGDGAAIEYWWMAPTPTERHGSPASPLVGMPATVTDMPMSYEERASKAGKASAAAKTPEERAEAARTAAAGAHGLVATARKLVARWNDASDEERREARRELRKAAGLIR